MIDTNLQLKKRYKLVVRTIQVQQYVIFNFI